MRGEGHHLRERVRHTSPKRLPIEVAAPYLPPRDPRPNPAHLPQIATAIAACRGGELAELPKRTTGNAEKHQVR